MNMKAAASLTGSLLARKGAAYPAAYSAPTPSPEGAGSSDTNSAPRAYNDPRVIASAPPAPVTSAPAPAPQHGEQMQDGRPAPTPAPSMPVAEAPMPEIAVDGEAVDGVGLPQTMDKMGRVRLSVRLDPDRYLRVKMASARTRWSAQDIVIAALDRYLGGKGGSESEADNSGSGGDNSENLN